MVGAGKTGFARQPRGATIRIGRTSPELTGMCPCTAVSRSTERTVSHTAMSTVPTSGMLMGRSGTWSAVPVRSTVISSPSTVMVATRGRLRFVGSSLSRKPSMKVVAVQVPSGRPAMAERISRSAWSLAASPAASTVSSP